MRSLLLVISSGTVLILDYENSLGLVIYQLMSKEELPISGDRWSELRKGEVHDRFIEIMIVDSINRSIF